MGQPNTATIARSVRYKRPNGMADEGPMRQRALFASVGALLTILSGCGGQSMPGLHFGSEEGGSSYGLDTLPFEVRRADGTVLTGHASVRLLRVQFYTRDAKKLVVCSGSFALDREQSSVPMSVDCTGTRISHGTVTTALSDHGEGTFTEQSGRTSTFRYGASLSSSSGG